MKPMLAETKMKIDRLLRDDDGSDYDWDMEIAVDVAERIERLETAPKLTRFELYEELLELMAVLELYWRGLSPERQQSTAREVRRVLRKFEALKTRMQDWAAKELRKRMRETGRIPLAEWDAVCAEDMR